MLACEPALVAFAVHSDVLLVLLAKLLASLDDHLVTASVAHWFGGVVGVAASSIPVTLLRLWIKSHIAAHQLTHAKHQVARHPHMVTRIDAFARANLILPLARHDLSIDASDLDASIEGAL